MRANLFKDECNKIWCNILRLLLIKSALFFLFQIKLQCSLESLVTVVFKEYVRLYLIVLKTEGCFIVVILDE